MLRHPNFSRHPATLAVLLAQGALAIQWSSPQTGDIISPGDMILAAWYVSLILMTATVANSTHRGSEKKTDAPILRLCSQGVGDREADCSVLGSSEFSHRKNGELASLLCIRSLIIWRGCSFNPL